MLVQSGNNWIQKIPLTAKIGRGRRPSPICLSEECFESNYFQIGQYVVQLHIQILTDGDDVKRTNQNTIHYSKIVSFLACLSENCFLLACLSENCCHTVIFFCQCCSRSFSFISKCSRNEGKTKKVFKFIA